MRKQILPAEAQLVDSQGRATPDFYELLKNIMENLPTKKVKFIDPTAGQYIRYNAATDQYEPN